ncbi:uncharacterized protein F5147DRAFT_259551 [Suillus discolor]|uniref:DRBM domain-containing protein n=1 Tax=Suillus discolor TaxID=1912936 RepID=A0A9P7FIB4_9AGAM|nr:uncharacterized protein F5147DRAFT_259551 [Suillus discolor]KAG2118179.1 hypothetical protein F5147DRAFT_259551 [Suillus discolor]
MSSHSVMNLNNIMQAKYGISSTSRIKYEETPSGPQNNTVWTVTYFINDMKYGEASATAKRVAKEAAAQKTIEMLQAED